MTAEVIQMRPRHESAGPCNSGTTPGGVSKPCGDPDTKLYPAGPRCKAHVPASPILGGAA